MTKKTPSSELLWAPLQIARFRWLWIGALTMNLAIWMQNVGAAWMMVSLTPAPMLVALVQTAISLPSFFFGLPGGVFADIFDRRRYLVLTHGGMLVSAVLLVVCSFTGAMNAWALLLLTFAFGIGFALQGPAWYICQVEAVPRPLLTAAMALSSVSYSSARAVGPALAGGVVAVSGVASVFVACVVLLVCSLISALTVRTAERDESVAPETIWGGLRGTLSYARGSDVIREQSIRSVAFVAAGSAVWALLPLLAKASGGAGNYGLLLGSIGAGTMFGAMVMPGLRARMGINRLVASGCLIYAVGMVLVALVSVAWVQWVALFGAGIGWMCVGTSNLVAIQASVAPWIRARSVAIYMLVFQGSLAVGGAWWGAIATRTSTQVALLLAAVSMIGALWVMYRYPVKMDEEEENTPFGDDQPDVRARTVRGADRLPDQRVEWP